jgi:hypothetical protein
VNVALKAAAVGRNVGDRAGQGPDEEKEEEIDRENGVRLEDKHPPTSEGSRRASSGYQTLPNADFKFQTSKAQQQSKKKDSPAAAKLLSERAQGGQLSFREEILATGAFFFFHRGDSRYWCSFFFFQKGDSRCWCRFVVANVAA